MKATQNYSRQSEAAKSSKAGALKNNDNSGAISPIITGKTTSETPKNSLIITAKTSLEALVERAAEYAEDSQAENTRKAYASDWRDFVTFCTSEGFPAALPVGELTLALYVVERAKRNSISTIQRRLAAIRAMHVEAGLPRPDGPQLRKTWAGLRRNHGAPPKPKQPITVEVLRDLLSSLPNTTAGVRDRALLLIGFGAALRRSELAALSIEGAGPVWFRFVPKGMEIHVDRSKGDQGGAGAVVVIERGKHVETCAIRALRSWLDAAPTAGRVFRGVTKRGVISEASISAEHIATVVKRSCEAAGLDPVLFAGHSLRSGMATSAAEAGVDGVKIQGKLRHKKFDTTAGYIRSADRFKDDPSGKLGL